MCVLIKLFGTENIRVPVYLFRSKCKKVAPVRNILVF